MDNDHDQDEAGPPLAYAAQRMPSRSALRLFIALYPPPEAARAMLARLAGLTLPTHRATREDQLHLTLFFAGDTDPRQLDAVIESVERSASGIGTITLTPRALVSLPEHGPPRLLALETDAPTNLLELQRRLAQRLSRRPHHADGPFRPHFTLCRYGAPGSDCLRDVVSIPPFAVDRVAVVESVLRPTGAHHSVIESIPLA